MFAKHKIILTWPKSGIFEGSLFWWWRLSPHPLHHHNHHCHNPLHLFIFKQESNLLSILIIKQPKVSSYLLTKLRIFIEILREDVTNKNINIIKNPGLYVFSEKDKKNCKYHRGIQIELPLSFEDSWSSLKRDSVTVVSMWILQNH